MDKLLWDAMAASAITITMEDFFSTFLKKKTTKRNYVAMWLFYFIYHMTIMNLVALISETIWLVLIFMVLGNIEYEKENHKVA